MKKTQVGIIFQSRSGRVLAIIGLLIVLSVFSRLRTVMVILLLGGFTFVFGSATRIFHKSGIGLSFTKFLIMLLMYWFGVKVAVFAAPLLQMGEWIGQQNYSPSYAYTIPNVMLMPVYGMWILFFDIAWAGIVLLAIANIIEIFFSRFIASEPIKVWTGYLTNFLFNVPVIWQIGPLLLPP